MFSEPPRRSKSGSERRRIGLPSIGSAQEGTTIARTSSTSLHFLRCQMLTPFNTAMSSYFEIPILSSAKDSAPSAFDPEFLPQRTPSLPQRSQRGDRKSTRLNSSHTVISYAVFCLKKKKITPVD